MMTTLFDTVKQLFHCHIALDVTVSNGFSDSTIRTIEVRSKKAGIYEIVSENITTMECYQELFDAENFDLAVSTWDIEVEDLQDDYSYCGSDHLRWKDVEIKVREKQFIAPSIGRLKKALTHLTFCAADRYGY